MKIRKLFPATSYKNLTEIPLSMLRDLGIRGIIIDLDNTLTFWGLDNIEQKKILWLEEAKRRNFKILIFSNTMGKESWNQRLKRIGHYLKIEVLAGKKPNGFSKAVEKIGLPASKIAVIGDQVFRDVLGGNKIGAYTILVSSISKKEFFGTRILRPLEKIILYCYQVEEDFKYTEL